MAHIEEHCGTPSKFRRWNVGSVWVCDCGQVWVLRYGIYDNYRKVRYDQRSYFWEKLNIGTK